MTDKQIVELLDRALEQAIVAQFCHLFGVLMAAGDMDDGLERFDRGLAKLMNTATAVAEIIRTMED